MAKADPVPPGASEPQFPTEHVARQVRILKFVVISLGVLLLVGFAVVIGRIAYLATQPGGGIGASSPLHEMNVVLPAGAVIGQTTVSGDRMAVHYASPAETGIIVINLTTGRVVSRIGFTPEASGQQR
jgi:hypothetical protein